LLNEKEGKVKIGCKTVAKIQKNSLRAGVGACVYVLCVNCKGHYK